MSTLRTIGKITLSLIPGALAALMVARLVDDRRVARIWQALDDVPAERQSFTADMVADLPEPARRYFLHAIRPGAPLASRLYWRYTGSMRPGKQAPPMDLTVEQIIAKERGFVWKALARRGAVIMTAADHYLDGDARMRISAYGLVPVINSSGPDIARSSLGRLLVECCAMPSALLPGPHVHIESVDESHFRALIDLQGESTPITLTVDPQGRLQEIQLPRWGNITDDGAFRFIPYGAKADDERAFGGYTIPGHLVVGWWYGTDRYVEQIELRVHDAWLY